MLFSMLNMKSKTSRLFINNLDNGITEEDIREKFSVYGTVASIEIKERKNPVGNQTQKFAYININAEDNVLHNCIEEFANKKWKGQYLNLQVAKESFIDRLKREREQNDVQDSLPMVTASSELKPINININKYQNHHVQSMPSKQTIKKANNDEGKIANYNQDNEKRLKSLMCMKEGYRQQKLQIKNALSNIDKANSNNKIRFDDHSSSGSKKVKDNVSSTRGKVQLFNDEDYEDNTDLSFKIQPQFDGAKGQKLMQLQSRFRNDDRFKLDSRFLDEDDEEMYEQIDKNTESVENETEKQLEILESVLGKKLKRPSFAKEVIDKKKSKMMLRFDPSQPQHSKFEVPQESVKEVKIKKKEKMVNSKMVEELPPPEVSKETLYTITADLKTTLQDKESFSLGKLFDTQIEQDLEKVGVEEPTAKPKMINKMRETGPDPKVFRYDSTDDEDDNKTEAKATTGEIAESKNPGFQIKPRMWTETFFFKEDDYRLQEGFDFIKRLQLGEQGDFKFVRRNLKEIVRAKVKNNLRKNRPFKRKLGGNKKRIKVKRALKR